MHRRGVGRRVPGAGLVAHARGAARGQGAASSCARVRWCARTRSSCSASPTSRSFGCSISLIGVSGVGPAARARAALGAQALSARARDPEGAGRCAHRHARHRTQDGGATHRRAARQARGGPLRAPARRACCPSPERFRTPSRRSRDSGTLRRRRRRRSRELTDACRVAEPRGARPQRARSARKVCRADPLRRARGPRDRHRDEPATGRSRRRRTRASPIPSASTRTQQEEPRLRPARARRSSSAKPRCASSCASFIEAAQSTAGGARPRAVPRPAGPRQDDAARRSSRTSWASRSRTRRAP